MQIRLIQYGTSHDYYDRPWFYVAETDTLYLVRKSGYHADVFAYLMQVEGWQAADFGYNDRYTYSYGEIEYSPGEDDEMPEAALIFQTGTPSQEATIFLKQVVTQATANEDIAKLLTKRGVPFRIDSTYKNHYAKQITSKLYRFILTEDGEIISGLADDVSHWDLHKQLQKQGDKTWLASGFFTDSGDVRLNYVETGTTAAEALNIVRRDFMQHTSAELEELEPGDRFLNWRGDYYYFEPFFEGDERLGLNIVEDDDIIGSITWTDEGDFIYLRSAYVDPAYRGQGIFKMLFNELTRRYPGYPIDGDWRTGGPLEAFMEDYNRDKYSATDHAEYVSTFAWNKDHGLVEDRSRWHELLLEDLYGSDLFAYEEMMSNHPVLGWIFKEGELYKAILASQDYEFTTVSDREKELLLMALREKWPNIIFGKYNKWMETAQSEGIDEVYTDKWASMAEPEFNEVLPNTNIWNEAESS